MLTLCFCAQRKSYAPNETEFSPPGTTVPSLSQAGAQTSSRRACTIKFHYWYLTLVSPKGTQRILAPPPFAALVSWLGELLLAVHPPRPLPPHEGSSHLLGNMTAFVSTEHTTEHCDCCKLVRSLPHLTCTNAQGSLPAALPEPGLELEPWGLQGVCKYLLAPLHGIRRSAWSLCLASCMPTSPSGSPAYAVWWVVILGVRQWISEDVTGSLPGGMEPGVVQTCGSTGRRSATAHAESCAPKATLSTQLSMLLLLGAPCGKATIHAASHAPVSIALPSAAAGRGAGELT